MKLPVGWDEPPPHGRELVIAHKTFANGVDVTLYVVMEVEHAVENEDGYQVWMRERRGSVVSDVWQGECSVLTIEDATSWVEALATDKEEEHGPPPENMTVCERARRLFREGQRTPARASEKTAEALRLLEAEVATDPTNVVLLTCLGAILNDVGEFKRAMDVLERAIALGSEDGNTFYTLAAATVNGVRGRDDDARRLFAKAATMTPSPETWRGYFDGHGH